MIISASRIPASTGRRTARFARLPALAAFAVMLHAVPATTAAASGQSEALARFRQERAACMDGTSHQDRATCLKEAGAALHEARRGRLDDATKSYERNRLVRCNGVAPADREDCLRRMRGDGTVGGSVERGGIYRELRTTNVDTAK